jgi:SAM-dependent methyltransferase
MLDMLGEDYRDAFACPHCRGPLTTSGGNLACPQCHRVYAAAGGYLDFAPEVRMKPGLGPFYLQDPLHVPRYEQHTRPYFLDIMGANWDRELTPEDEDDYLRAHLLPAPGLVLDLGCGAGRWTRTIARHVGMSRVAGLDLSVAMIELIRRELPGLCVVRGTAVQLPFATGSLGAVNCSNALQLMPDPRAVVQEVGRCLRPGGVFTVFTFRQAGTPAYRYFQQRHEQMFNVRSFQTAELVTWLGSAGLELVDLSTRASILLFTARR